MLSRIFWVGIAGIALVAGMALQDGDWIFGSDDRSVDAGIDRTVDRVTDRAVARIQVAGPDGRTIDVPPETKRAMADAVGRLVKAEADLAMVRVRNGSGEEIQAATARRDQARAEVEAMKAAIKQQEQAAKLAGGSASEQIERDIRDEIRADVREALRN